MQVPIPHIYLSQILQMPNSPGSQIGCIDQVKAKRAAKSDEITIERKKGL